MYIVNNKEEISNRNRIVDVIPSIKELCRIGGSSGKKIKDEASTNILYNTHFIYKKVQL